MKIDTAVNFSFAKYFIKCRDRRDGSKFEDSDVVNTTGKILAEVKNNILKYYSILGYETLSIKFEEEISRIIDLRQEYIKNCGEQACSKSGEEEPKEKSRNDG